MTGGGGGGGGGGGDSLARLKPEVKNFFETELAGMPRRTKSTVARGCSENELV